MPTAIQQFESGATRSSGKPQLADSVHVDAINQCLWRGPEQINLSPKAFGVLLHLADRPGRLVTKQELLDSVWPDTFVTEGVLKRAVLEIRKALADPVDEPRFIQTLHRRGYRFLRQRERQPAACQSVLEHAGIFGRESELHQLDQYLARALNSSRQMVFITGETGLGKTTLIDSWESSVSRRPVCGAGNVVVARGRCLQQFGGAEPYMPVFEALHDLSRKLGRRLVEVLRAYAPTWLANMPALTSLEDRAKLRDETSGVTRERMLREITDALEVLSGETAIVIVLEDLQWSDPSTVDLLSAIATRRSAARLMILATYRPGEAARRGASLLEVVSQMHLHKQCEMIPLSYLSEHATDEYLAFRFPAMDQPGPVTAALHRRTNGNPLYLNCLVDELTRTRGTAATPEVVNTLIPDAVQQVFEREVAQLKGPEQELLKLPRWRVYPS